MRPGRHSAPPPIAPVPLRGEWLEGPLHATDIPSSMATVRAKYGDQRASTDLAVASKRAGVAVQTAVPCFEYWQRAQ